MCLDYNSISYMLQRDVLTVSVCSATSFGPDALRLGAAGRRRTPLPAAVPRRHRRSGAGDRNGVLLIDCGTTLLEATNIAERCRGDHRRCGHPPGHDTSPLRPHSRLGRVSRRRSAYAPPAVAAALTTEIGEVRAHAHAATARTAEVGPGDRRRARPRPRGDHRRPRPRRPRPSRSNTPAPATPTTISSSWSRRPTRARWSSAATSSRSRPTRRSTTGSDVRGLAADPGPGAGPGRRRTRVYVPGHGAVVDAGVRAQASETGSEAGTG